MIECYLQPYLPSVIRMSNKITVFMKITQVKGDGKSLKNIELSLVMAAIGKGEYSRGNRPVKRIAL